MSWVPDHEVDILAGTPPGGGLDRTAHALCDALSGGHLLPVPARVVNMPGDGARKVWQALDAREWDAHVLCISHPNLATDLLTGLANFSHERYTPLAILYNEYIAFAVRQDSPLRSAQDLLQRLHGGPGSVRVALSTAAGNPNHIAVALVARHAGGDMRAPAIRVFDSALDALADVLTGKADLAAVTAASVVPALDAGRMRALALSAPERLSGVFESVPTWQELGVPCVVGAWRGVHGARHLSPDAFDYWVRVLSEVTHTASWREVQARQHWTPMLITGNALRTHLAREHAMFAQTLTELGLTNT
jgi:putative tricarboxylic transport membrane protein